jgi:membrane protease YdiL (CAAX protease family)
LGSPSPEPGAAREEAASVPPPQAELAPATRLDADLSFPEYKWSARDGWKCLGFLVLLEVIQSFLTNALVLRGAIPPAYASGYGYVLRRSIHYAAFLLTAAYFARTETFSSFWAGFGFARKPSDYAWFGVVMALIIRAVGHALLAHHWGKGATAYDISAFHRTVGAVRYLYLVPLLIFAPLFEEAVNRGFLYKAFRGSYRIGPSMLLIVTWTAVTHFNQYPYWIAAVDLSLLTLVQCYLREKSDSLWDCVLCHLAYNGSLIFLGLFG